MAINFLISQNIDGGITTTSSSSMAGINMTSGLAMGSNAISGTNYNIGGVNQLTFNDPGEGIVFAGTTNVGLFTVDDATDSILRISNASALDVNCKITDLTDPTSAQDAATKSYVDTQISGVPQGTVTSVATGTGLTGGTITSSGTISVDSSVVLTNNTQTISGAKTISDTLTMSADIDFESSNASILMGASSTFQVDGDSGVGKYLKSVSGGLEWATVTTGTVTSVGITAGAGISVSNSPITSSGNITVTNTITNNTQLTNGEGFTTNTGTVTSIATTSPITGGTITGSGTIALDQSAITSLANLAETGTVTAGVWNSNTQLDKTSSTFLDYQGEVVYWASSTVVKGKIYVYQGGDWVAADADAASTSSGTLAVALNNGTSSTVGMLTRGTITLTDLGNDGDLLYLDTNAGNLTTEPPSGSGDIVRIVGQLLDGTNGQIFFNPDYTFITLS